MKRTIYILTAIFSAIAAAVFIIDIIGYIIEINTEFIPAISPEGEYSYSYYFPIIAATLVTSILEIAAMLAFCVLSLVQLKKHTPRIMLLLCGYVFYDAALTISGQYLFGLLLMAAALMPAVYELSRYGMTVRLEPKRTEKKRWLLAAAFALALALLAYRVVLSITHAISIGLDIISFDALMFYPTNILGVFVPLCAAAFCTLMNRRTSVLYRMFFTGCVLCDAIPLVIAQRGNFPGFFQVTDTVRIFFISMSAIYALFILLIFIHAFLTRRGSLITQEAPDITQQAFNNAKAE